MSLISAAAFFTVTENIAPKTFILCSWGGIGNALYFWYDNVCKNRERLTRMRYDNTVSDLFYRLEANESRMAVTLHQSVTASINFAAATHVDTGVSLQCVDWSHHTLAQAPNIELVHSRSWPPNARVRIWSLSVTIVYRACETVAGEIKREHFSFGLNWRKRVMPVANSYKSRVGFPNVRC